MTPKLSLILLGFDQQLKDLGISFLRGIFQEKLELPRHALDIVCIADDDGYYINVIQPW